jgi:LPXTG-site transpeptidase (sortase) family protein
VHIETRTTAGTGGNGTFNPPPITASGSSRDSPASHHSSYLYGDFLGVLKVERMNRAVNVYAGATMEAMDKGGGHFSFTGLNSGNTAIIGHNRGSAGFFSFVKDLRQGDIITLEAGGVTRRYAVSMTYTISESDFEPLMQFGDTRLTLVTCLEYQRDQRRVAVLFEIP